MGVCVKPQVHIAIFRPSNIKVNKHHNETQNTQSVLNPLWSRSFFISHWTPADVFAVFIPALQRQYQVQIAVLTYKHADWHYNGVQSKSIHNVSTENIPVGKITIVTGSTYYYY